MYQFSLLLICITTTDLFAGVYYSGQTVNALPVEWPGFLRDHRALRQASSPGAGFAPLRERYAEASLKLEAQAKIKPLSADEAADLAALYIRLNKPEKAIALLRPYARQHAEHFRIQANLGSAWQLTGDLEQARLVLAEAVNLAPKEWKRFEEFHYKLVRLRLKEKKDVNAPDDLFGVKFTGIAGKLAADEKKKLPDDAVAIVQQLAIWFPNDARLLWQLAELANADGDITTAASLMEGVVEFGLKSEDARARRLLFRAASDELAKLEDHPKHKSAINFASNRVYPRLIDEATLPKIDPTGVNALPWATLSETTLMGKKFDPKFLKYLDDLDGKKVTLPGFMRPTRDDGKLSEFLLTENAIGCWFCESPGPTQVIWVTLPQEKSIEFRRTPIQVTGVLKLNRTDPEQYLFEIIEAQVKGVD